MHLRSMGAKIVECDAHATEVDTLADCVATAEIDSGDSECEGGLGEEWFDDAFDVRPMKAPASKGAGRLNLNNVRRSRRVAERLSMQIAHRLAFKSHRAEVVQSAMKVVKAAQEQKSAAAEATRVARAKKHAKAPTAHKALDLVPGQTLTCDSFWFGAQVETSVEDSVARAKTVVPAAGERCCVCLGDFADDEDGDEPIVQMPKCRAAHPFHRACILAALQVTPRCPQCLVTYSSVLGTQPPGRMTITHNDMVLPGEHTATAIIEYTFPNGVQGPRNPNPGERFSGTHRLAYVPLSSAGKMVLTKLMRGWDRRVLFTVGTSITTGCTNTVVWNGVHHKTAVHGGPAMFGFPDATYLARVTQELAAFDVV